ncbi:class I SAM-dependent methyltransferase [Kitasatospora brasiliensis]|uniref:class I SAM-dependent methyltransferase n=1 Tax=Kitasatospora brasiliensis TaxID=3058040 RepID=UPI00292D355E|nr:SAM-dependent methyltransferase [Kitasatospora sp. K002]
MEAVSKTAQWTAAARALESEREDAVFVDPYARTVAADTGFKLLDRYAGAGTVEFLAIRTGYLDRAIAKAVADQGIRQVVFVAAGMDTRPYRLDCWAEGTTVYELDRPALLLAKDQLLDNSEPPNGIVRQPVAVDLAGDWTEMLLLAGFRPNRPTLWVIEGLSFFLAESDVRRLLGAIRKLSAAGTVLLGDFASKFSLVNPLARPFLNALAEDGAPWRFGTDEPETFLAECGWQAREVRQPGDDGAEFGRWPYRVVPREVPGVPRSFLYTADPA